MASLDFDLLRRLARAVLATPDAYAFARIAPLLGEHDPQCREWLTGYVQSLVRLGLHAAAKQVVEVIPAESRTGPEFAALDEALARARTGLIPWTSRKGRYRANLDALRQRDAQGAAAVENDWREHVDGLELHESRDGHFAIKLAGAVWPPRWIPFLDDHKSLATDRLNLVRQGLLPEPLVFCGLGMGWEFSEAYFKTQRVFLEASSTLYVIEPSAASLAALFHVHDWREVIADPRVRWFIGHEALSRFREEIAGDSAWPLTERVYSFPLLGEPAAPLARAAMHAVAAARTAEVEQLTARLTQLYEGRDAAWWAKRYHDALAADGRAQGEPLRILAITSRHTTFLQYSIRDCLKVLDRFNHRTRLLIEPTPHQPLDVLTAMRAQAEFEPDLVFLLSRMRYEMTAVVHPSIPSLTWDQDALPWVFDANRKPELAWNDFLMGFAAASAARRFGWPEHRCRYCAMAGSSDTYLADPLPDCELTPFRCDVSYVSHASAPVEQEMASVESWLASDKQKALFREVAPGLIAFWQGGGEFPCAITEPLIDACEGKGWNWTSEELGPIVQVIQRLGDRVFRHVALGWVADWADRTGRDFRIYGNGWEKHPRLAKYARGATRNGDELRRVYQGTRINLQLMGFGFLHQRALDGLMAGAFFMTRRSATDGHGVILRKLLRHLEESGVRTAAQLRGMTDDAMRRRIESAMREVTRDPRDLDARVVENIRDASLAPYARETVADYDAVAFRSATEFAHKAEAFLLDGPSRARVAARMRQAIYENFSYDARMKEMLHFVRNGFAREAQRSRASVEPGLSDVTTSPASDTPPRIEAASACVAGPDGVEGCVPDRPAPSRGDGARPKATSGCAPRIRRRPSK